MTYNDLVGKVAIVTGAAGGMGAVMARALAAEGARIAAVDVKEEGLTALAADFEPGQILPIEADLASPAVPADVVARTIEAMDGLHIVVNNAGIGMRFVKPDYALDPARFWETDPDRWQRVMDTNVRAPMLLARAAVPHFLTQGWGRIICVTTSLDTMLTVHMAPYGQSKAALEAGAAIWAKELAGTGVAVNVLIPGGPVDTAFLPDNTTFPRDKLIKAEVMAAPVAWLCSESANGVTGRRFIARQWDATLPASEAAQKCSAPAAWEGLGVSSVRPT